MRIINSFLLNILEFLYDRPFVGDAAVPGTAYCLWETSSEYN